MKNSYLSILLLAAFCSCHSQKADVPQLKDEPAPVVTQVKPLPPSELKKYHDTVEDIMQRNLLRGSFNGAILVAKNGNVVYEHYAGVMDPRLKGKDSLSAETSFQIASTGKTMTSAAVLKLWEQGKLNINDEVTKYFPGFPYPGVTIKTLLNHRSGLPNYLYYFEKAKWNRQQQVTNTDVLNSLIQWQPPKSAAADKRFQYCNTNYVLLALIVEKVSGQAFPDFMKKTFFEPLGMNHSFVIGPNQQPGHMVSFQGNNALWALDFSDGPYGDKNIYSTPRDLLTWDRALTDGRVLQKATLDSAYTPYSNEKPGVHNYGLGWRLLFFPEQSKEVIYHNGHWHGFHSAFSRLPNEDATIIILTNKHNNLIYTVAKKVYEVFGRYNGKPEDGEE
ncbi:serine hydrolase domain-containing protein [Flavisolibacter nicotianae]|uniref:serine hydrolase domain-containing protein n=1 Tax=Flavisolibacter nicotianae TaxID=2364882 RepID=UPI000EB33BD6|nr:serine hydrolase domain-containing protein [Flavisolibacter nicotianae]